MIILTMYFNVRDYFDRSSAQSDTVLKFQYIKGLLWLHNMHSRTKMTITHILNYSYTRNFYEICFTH